MRLLSPLVELLFMSKSWLKTPQEQLRDFGDLFDKAMTPTFTNEELGRWKDSEFDGVTYEPKFDADRLRGEIARVYRFMKQIRERWWTLKEISYHTGDPEASISARLRDLRKAKFGSHTVNRRRRGDPKRGLFEYQLL